ncbi:hypothetical protein ABK040_010407 [Willaertia magna]
MFKFLLALFIFQQEKQKMNTDKKENKLEEGIYDQKQFVPESKDVINPFHSQVKSFGGEESNKGDKFKATDSDKETGRPATDVSDVLEK